MTKLLNLPQSRLVCFGEARRHTNAPPSVGQIELEPPEEFEG